MPINLFQERKRIQNTRTKICLFISRTRISLLFIFLRRFLILWYSPWSSLRPFFVVKLYEQRCHVVLSHLLILVLRNQLIQQIFQRQLVFFMLKTLLLDKQVNHFLAFLPVLPNPVARKHYKIVSWTSCKCFDIWFTGDDSLIPGKIFIVFQFKIPKGSRYAQHVVNTTSINITICFLYSLNFNRILWFVILRKVDSVTAPTQNASGITGVGHIVKFFSY